jgi:predicted acetyltransferase
LALSALLGHLTSPNAILAYIRLIIPTTKYKDSYAMALKELVKESENPSKVRERLNTLDVEIARLSLQNKRPLKGRVTYSEYWLVDKGEYIGTIQIRYKPSGKFPASASHIYFEIRPSKRGRGYGTALLRFGLRRARHVGFSEVLLSCAPDNLPSIHTIESNGGVYLGTFGPAEGRALRMYRINLRPTRGFDAGDRQST